MVYYPIGRYWMLYCNQDEHRHVPASRLRSGTETNPTKQSHKKRSFESPSIEHDLGNDDLIHWPSACYRFLLAHAILHLAAYVGVRTHPTFPALHLSQEWLRSGTGPDGRVTVAACLHVKI